MLLTPLGSHAAGQSIANMTRIRSGIFRGAHEERDEGAAPDARLPPPGHGTRAAATSRPRHLSQCDAQGGTRLPRNGEAVKQRDEPPKRARIKRPGGGKVLHRRHIPPRPPMRRGAEVLSPLTHG